MSAPTTVQVIEFLDTHAKLLDEYALLRDEPARSYYEGLARESRHVAKDIRQAECWHAA